MTKNNILIIGAGSSIAQALVTELLASTPEVNITIVSRNLSAYKQMNSSNLRKMLIENYQQTNIEKTASAIMQDSEQTFSQVYLCNGLLHNEVISPEKRIEEFCPESFLATLTVNALTPLLWIKALTPLFSSKSECKLVVFSARVGSIEDNKLGGWYSYRASKAALNMMLKNVAIEFSRRAKNTKVIAFHPGTTDTALSKPFHKNVPEGKLFTTKFVAKQLLEITAAQAFDQQISFLDWQGKTVKW